MSPMCLNAGDVTVSFAPPLAGSVGSADAARPTSFSGGGPCAEANVGASSRAVHVMMSARRVIGWLSISRQYARRAFATAKTQERALTRPEYIKTRLPLRSRACRRQHVARDRPKRAAVNPGLQLTADGARMSRCG